MTRRPALVEEILDDTMLVVWRRAHTYVPDAKVSTWIFGIAYRQAIKALRGIDDAHEPGDEALPETAASDPDRELQSLSAEQRAVIELTYYLGYACRETAQIMDCPVATVKTRMFYARRRLKAVLGGQEELAL